MNSGVKSDLRSDCGAQIKSVDHAFHFSCCTRLTHLMNTNFDWLIRTQLTVVSHVLVIVVELDRLVGVWTVRARTLVSLSPAEEVSQRHPTLLPGKQSRLLSPDLPTKQCHHPDSSAVSGPANKAMPSSGFSDFLLFAFRNQLCKRRQTLSCFSAFHLSSGTHHVRRQTQCSTQSTL